MARRGLEQESVGGYISRSERILNPEHRGRVRFKATRSREDWEGY